MKNPQISKEKNNKRTDLKSYCLRAPVLGSMLVFVALGGTWGMYSPILGDRTWTLLYILFFIEILFCAGPVIWFLFGRKLQRSCVRGYLVTTVVIYCVYAVGGLFLLFPILFVAPGPYIKTGLLVIIILILTHVTWAKIKEVRRVMHKLDFPAKAFIDTGSVIVFDRKNQEIWEKEANDTVVANKLQFWLIMAAAPLAPVSATLIPADQGIPWAYLIFPAVSEYMVAYLWSKLLITVGAMFIYPIYLEFKTGKPVIEIGTVNGLR